MSDEEAEEDDDKEEEVEAQDEPLPATPRAITFCQAFCLPGVLPVSAPLPTSRGTFIQTNETTHADSVYIAAAVLPGLCMSEAGQLLLLLLASFLPEQQLWLEGS